MIEEKGDLMYPLIRQRFETGLAVTGPQFVADWQELDRLRVEWATATAGFDAVLLPSCAILPPNVAAMLADPEAFVARNLETLRNTRVGNLMDLCGLTLPTGTPHCGLMALAPAGDERRLLRLGAAMESSL